MKIIIALVVLLLIPILLIVDGFVFQTLWSWFIVPFGLPSLSIAAAIGIVGTIRYVAHQYNPINHYGKEANERVSDAMIYIVGRPVVALAVGYIVHLCV